jgi:superfamily I DNA and/or RNA helicase
MHQDIAEPVGRAFYQVGAGAYDDDGLPKTFLETGSTANRPHGVTVPDYLTGRALVWIDTDGIDDCTEHPRWFNPGEVRIITRIVEQMRPKPLPPDQNGDNSLVVLTPYTAQVSELNKTSTLAKRVHTVHSFQGRQADRVIVSLVRSRRSAGSTVAANVGHVGQDEVVNVLLSRARRLLVLVGNLRHFAEYGGPSWQTITTVVQRQRGVVGFDEQALR